MKNTLLTGLIFMLLLGCQKFREFEENELAKFSSEEKMVNAVTGAYDRFKTIFMYSRMMPNSGWDIAREWYQQPNSRGDDFNHSPLYNGYYELIDGQFVYTCSGIRNPHFYPYSEISETWYDYYKTIITLNNIITHAENQDELSSGIKKILGEAYLLRAYTYYRLVRVYGQIPLVRDIKVSYQIRKSTFMEIYDFIEQDLKTAINLLPLRNTEARIPYSTPHIGTAKIILGEVYLTRGGFPLKQTEYYAKAAELTGDIIDNAAFYGFELMTDYADLWEIESQWNNETVFALNYQDNYLYNGLAISGGALGDSVKVFSLSFRGSMPYSPGIKFYNDYPESYRKSVSFYSLCARPYSPESVFNSIQQFIERDSMDLCSPIYYRKFDHVWSVDSSSLYNPSDYNNSLFSKSLNDMNIYIFRYAQTLLTFAEAKARSGLVDADAYEAINQIRRRAHKLDLHSPSEYDLTPGLSAEQFADSVVWERAWELCAEVEGRWFDLVRLEKVEDLPLLRNENDMLDYPDMISKDFYFISIPESEIDFNPNLN